MPEPHTWSFKNGTKEFGPYNLIGVKNAAEKGWIGLNTLIRAEPDGEWIQAPKTGLIRMSILRRNTPGLPFSARNLLIAGIVLFLGAFAVEVTKDITRTFLRSRDSATPSDKHENSRRASTARQTREVFLAEFSNDPLTQLLAAGEYTQRQRGLSDGTAATANQTPRNIERTRVYSSAMRSVGYNESQRTLEIEFPNGAVYQYFGVPSEVHRGLIHAASHGRYFHRRIRNGNFEYERLK